MNSRRKHSSQFLCLHPCRRERLAQGEQLIPWLIAIGLPRAVLIGSGPPISRHCQGPTRKDKTQKSWCSATRAAHG